METVPEIIVTAEIIDRLVEAIQDLEQMRNRPLIVREERIALSKEIACKTELLSSNIARLDVEGSRTRVILTTSIDMDTIPGIEAEITRWILFGIPEFLEKRNALSNDAEEMVSATYEMAAKFKFVDALYIRRGRLKQQVAKEGTLLYKSAVWLSTLLGYGSPPPPATSKIVTDSSNSCVDQGIVLQSLSAQTSSPSSSSLSISTSFSTSSSACGAVSVNDNNSSKAKSTCS